MEDIILNGYAYPPAMPCSACSENGFSREATCKAMIDCLEANHPCTGTCFSQCRNVSAISGPAETCVTALTTAACPGANSCPLGGTLDCTTARALTLTPGGQVTDFSAPEWNATTGRFCGAHGLGGTIYQYAGTGSTSMVSVDSIVRSMKLNFTVTAGQYAGGGLYFDSCVNATGFTVVQFTAALTTGAISGCTLQVQLHTQEQRPATATNPSGGTCTATSCYQYPAFAIAGLSSTPITITAPFSGFSPSSTAMPTQAQVVGLQWQANSMSGTGSCSFDLVIDDIRFLTQ